MHISHFIRIFYVTESELPSGVESVLDIVVLSLREPKSGYKQLQVVLQPFFLSFYFWN